MTSQPPERNPAVAAWANIAPLVRASRPRTMLRFPAARLQAPSAAACRATSSGVRSLPTMPRMPETEIIRGSDMGEKQGGRGRGGREDREDDESGGAVPAPQPLRPSAYTEIGSFSGSGNAF